MNMNLTQVNTESTSASTERTLIADKTIVPVKLTLQDPSKNVDEAGMPRKPEQIVPNNPYEHYSSQQTGDNRTRYLRARFDVIAGPYEGSSFWQNFTVFHADPNNISLDITRENLRAFVCSNYNISWKDDSPEAGKLFNQVGNGWDFLNGLHAVVKVKLQPGNLKNDGSGDKWPDSNEISYIHALDRGTDIYYQYAQAFGVMQGQAAPTSQPAQPPVQEQVTQNVPPAQPAQPAQSTSDKPDWMKQ